MSEYAKYCKDEKKEEEEWVESIRQLINYAGILDYNYLLSELHGREYAGSIMVYLSKDNNWQEIFKIVKEQGHSGSSISLLGQIMINFSPIGIEFTKQILGKTMLKSPKNCISRVYKKELKRRKQNSKNPN